MIIDVHYHLSPYPIEYENLLGNLGEQSRLARAAGINIDDFQLFSLFFTLLVLKN